MARRDTAARRYAEAAFEIGRSERTLDTWERDLQRLADALADEELALLVDLLVEAGVLAVGGPFGQRSLGLRPEADAWLMAQPCPLKATSSTTPSFTFRSIARRSPHRGLLASTWMSGWSSCPKLRGCL